MRIRTIMTGAQSGQQLASISLDGRRVKILVLGVDFHDRLEVVFSGRSDPDGDFHTNPHSRELLESAEIGDKLPGDLDNFGVLLAVHRLVTDLSLRSISSANSPSSIS